MAKTGYSPITRKNCSVQGVEVAFRAAFDSKHCPGCGGWRQRSIQVFCDRCEKQLQMNVMKGLGNKASFARAYYEAMKILRPELYVKKS